MWKIRENVTLDPIMKKIEISEECHDPISGGDHPDGSSNDGRHLPDRGVCHLGIYYKHLPGERDGRKGREGKEGRGERGKGVEGTVIFSDYGAGFGLTGGKRERGHI